MSDFSYDDIQKARMSGAGEVCPTCGRSIEDKAKPQTQTPPNRQEASRTLSRRFSGRRGQDRGE